MSNNSIIISGAGVGVSKNGAMALGGTFDPAWTASGVSYSADLLTASIGGSKTTGSTQHITAGKTYFEMTVTDWPTRYGPIIGIAPAATAVDGYTTPGAVAIWLVDGGSVNLYDSGGQVGAFPNVNFGLNDTVGFMVDLDGDVIAIYKNGVPTGITHPITGSDYLAFASSAGGAYPVTVTANFGAKSFL
jgi:hypothetical protein